MNLCFEMKKSDKKGQVGYSISALIILIGLIFFGILSLQNHSLTGQVISDPSLPGSCDDSAIEATWDSVFSESSEGISIVKNNTLFNGKCAEYFANKSDPNEPNFVYILYGYTREESNNNVTYLRAERVNGTSRITSDFLDNIDEISDVINYYPIRNDSFFQTYSNLRSESVSVSDDAEDVYNSVFKLAYSRNWEKGEYLNNESYSFSEDLGNTTSFINVDGRVMVNFTSEFFSYTFSPIERECGSQVDCGGWSNCSGGFQNRTCTNSSDCFEDYDFNQIRACGITCVQNWSVGNWSECVGGLQIRTVYDRNACGNETGMPTTNQTCGDQVGECIPVWSDCEDWQPSVCPQEEKQTRLCGDINNCGDPDEVVSETRSCTYEPTSSWLFILIIFIVILAILLAVVFIIYLFIKKNDEESGKNTETKSSQSPPPKPARPVQKKKILPQRFSQLKSGNFRKNVSKINSGNRSQSRSVQKPSGRLPSPKKFIQQKFTQKQKPGYNQPSLKPVQQKPSLQSAQTQKPVQKNVSRPLVPGKIPMQPMPKPNFALKDSAFQKLANVVSKKSRKPL